MAFFLFSRISIIKAYKVHVFIAIIERSEALHRAIIRQASYRSIVATVFNWMFHVSKRIVHLNRCILHSITF